MERQVRILLIAGTLLLSGLLVDDMVDERAFGIASGREARPSLNFTYLVADGTGGAFGSTAFRVWDQDITVFIEAFPNSTYCSWDPETVAEADLIIQNVHGHSSHYDPNECALVAKRTGAICVGNSQFKSDMVARGVSSSKIVELSPTMGGVVSASIPSLGIDISAYGMEHTYMTGTKVDTYLVTMPSGITWYHGTCSSGSNTMTYMAKYPELAGVDVMIADTDMNFGTLDNNYYPETLIKDHDFNSGANPKPATVYENYPTIANVMTHNGTYLYTMPDHQPELSGRTFTPAEGGPSTDFTFSIIYQYRAGKGPDTARIVIDGAPHDLPPPAGQDWRTGQEFKYATTLPSGQCKYHFEFSVDGKSVVFPVPDADGPKVNFPPELSDEAVTPPEGDDDDQYVFSVLYKDADNDPPMSRYLVLDGERISIPSADTTFRYGVNYTVKRELEVGEHSFHFEFTDRMDPVRYPAEGEFTGPTVVRANYAPVLYQPTLSDRSGTRETVFLFSVGYRDSHGDPPSVHDVVIDGERHEMVPSGTDFIEGVKFTFSTELMIGQHAYFFLFSDGQFETRYPAGDDDLSGPYVKDRAPIIEMSVPPQAVPIPDDQPVLLDAFNSSDPDGDALSFNWTSSVQGYLGNASRIEVMLVPGVHDIMLTVDDGFGIAVNETFTLTVVHYEARLEPGLTIAPSQPKEGEKVTVKVKVSNVGNEASGPTLVSISLDGSVLNEKEFASVLPGASVSMQGEFKASAGDHQVQVLIGEMVGASVNISVPARAPPVAEAGANVTVHVGEEVDLDGSGSRSSGTLVAFFWDFGDEKNATGAKASHTYSTPGTYVATLTVKDDLGKTASDSLTVTVLEREAPPEESDGGGSPILLIVAMAVVLLMIMAVLAIGTFLLLRRSRRSQTIAAPPVQAPVLQGAVQPEVLTGSPPPAVPAVPTTPLAVPPQAPPQDPGNVPKVP